MKIRLSFGVMSIVLLAGCHGSATIDAPPATQPVGNPSFEESLRVARERRLPVAIAIYDGSKVADTQIAFALMQAMPDGDKIVPVALNLVESRNRALAAPYHALEKPTLVCLSPMGMIVSRDEGDISVDRVRQRIVEAIERSPLLDRKLAELSASSSNMAARMVLADFLLSHQNDREAIPHLKRVADDESAEISVRIKAWASLGKAHLWVVEPEKARHSAQALIDTLGPKSPDAIAGGNLVRGLQDTKAKRFDRARMELQAAVAASPDSTYGREAKE